MVTASYNREQIRVALSETDINYSYYLDLESGEVVKIHDSDPADEGVRNKVFEGYGERYRYIPGGNPDADDAAVQTWLEAEGLD
jgi:hypothetical protein